MNKFLAIVAMVAGFVGGCGGRRNAGYAQRDDRGPRGMTTFSGSRHLRGRRCWSQGSVTGALWRHGHISKFAQLLGRHMYRQRQHRRPVRHRLIQQDGCRADLHIGGEGGAVASRGHCSGVCVINQLAASFAIQYAAVACLATALVSSGLNISCAGSPIARPTISWKASHRWAWRSGNRSSAAVEAATDRPFRSRSSTNTGFSISDQPRR